MRLLYIKEYQLVNPEKQKHHKGYKNSGTLEIVSAEVVNEKPVPTEVTKQLKELKSNDRIQYPRGICLVLINFFQGQISSNGT